MIPEEKSAAVERGLREAFGCTEIEDIRRITKGHTSALVFRIVVKGVPYLLRIIVRPSAILGPERHFGCMRAAADASLAPHVWYASIEDGLSITGFVEEVSFPRCEALVRIPSVLRTLHALPPFPGAAKHMNTTCTFLLNTSPAVDGLIAGFTSKAIVPDSETEMVLARYAQLVAACQCPETDLVSSHNDLFKPDNILFDGRRVWLVDWEAAFLNDRFVDLANAANLIVTGRDEETAFLERYFGHPPNEYERARYFLIQQVTHMFYAMVYLSMGSSGIPLSECETVPSFEDFQQRMWAGEVDLADKPTKLIYGAVHWERLLKNLRQARFGESLKIVSGNQRSS